MIHALPVLAALRARMPGALIDWVVEDRAADLLRERTDLDRVLVFPRRAMREALRGVPAPLRLARLAAGFVRSLRERTYDVALDLQGNLKSGLVLRASGAALRFGPGRAAAREGGHVFSQRRAVPPAGLRHRVERNLWLASALLGEPLPYVAPGYPVTQAQADEAAALLDAAGLGERPFVALQPGTSGFGSFKRWPAERFAALARGLGAQGLEAAVTHAPGEEALAEAVVRAGGPAARAVCTPGLGALAGVLARARLLVAGDTGPLHLAALLGTPVLGLFGPKDPDVYGPYGLRGDGSAGLLETLVQRDVACRPCRLRTCADPLCMRTLAPERVLERALALVQVRG